QPPQPDGDQAYRMSDGVGERQAEAQQCSYQGERRRGIAGADQAELAPRRDQAIDQQKEADQGEAHHTVAPEVGNGGGQPLELGQGRVSRAQPCMVKPPETLSVWPVMK